MTYTREFVPLVNDADADAPCACGSRRGMFSGQRRFGPRAKPVTASEDFARFLDHVPRLFRSTSAMARVDAALHNSSFELSAGTDALPQPEWVSMRRSCASSGCGWVSQSSLRRSEAIRGWRRSTSSWIASSLRFSQ